jgi:hypothetical protein
MITGNNYRITNTTPTIQFTHPNTSEFVGSVIETGPVSRAVAPYTMQFTIPNNVELSRQIDVSPYKTFIAVRVFNGSSIYSPYSVEISTTGPGDFNVTQSGTFSAADIQKMLRVVQKLDSCPVGSNCNLNGSADGVVNSLDSALAVKYALGQFNY